MTTYYTYPDVVGELFSSAQNGGFLEVAPDAEMRAA
jgi:hypothetical protein